jgi:hypothetical protein
MMSTKYFGYENYPTWCVALGLGNNQATFEYWREQATQVIAEASNTSPVQECYWDADKAAKYLLANRLQEAFDEANPLEEPDVWSDLLRAALDAVNWHEVAENILADVLPPRTASTASPETEPAREAAPAPLVVDLSDARFPLGFLVATPGALAAIPQGERQAALSRHLRGDWGLVGTDDWQANDRALVDETRLLSTYDTAAGERFWIITEADRSTTTVLLPDEY